MLASLTFQVLTDPLETSAYFVSSRRLPIVKLLLLGWCQRADPSKALGLISYHYGSTRSQAGFSGCSLRIGAHCGVT